MKFKIGDRLTQKTWGVPGIVIEIDERLTKYYIQDLNTGIVTHDLFQVAHENYLLQEDPNELLKDIL